MVLKLAYLTPRLGFSPDICLRASSKRGSLGTGCFLAKTDIKSAFRIIPFHPLEYPLLDIKWANEYSFDRCLAMGLNFFFASFAGIVRLFSRRFSHISCPKEITVRSFLPNIARSL